LIASKCIQKKPDRILYIQKESPITYEDFYRYGKNLVLQFQNKGLLGECIAFSLPNSIDLAILYLATFMAGAIAIPINPSLKQSERDYIVDQTKPKLMIDSSFQIRLETEEQGELVLPNPEDPLAVFFTSGSTSRPKGVTHTHKSFHAMLDTMTDAVDLTSEDRFLISESMNNASGCCHAYMPLFSGGSGVIVPHLDIPNLKEGLKHRPTVLSIMGRGNSDIINEPSLSKDHFEGVRLNFTGGDQVTGTLMDAFKKKTGVSIRYGYGMSEFLILTVNKSNKKENQTSIGQAAKNATLEFRDSKGNRCDREGEVYVKGPNMTIKYWNDPEETKKAIVGEWLRTGDLLSLDPEGFYWFVGRIKQMIIREGDNISPLEVESVLSKHPAVKVVGVIGIPHPTEGEVPKAFVELKQPATEKELIAFAKEHLEDYKVPVAIQVVESLPRTPNGKVARNLLSTIPLR